MTTKPPVRPMGSMQAKAPQISPQEKLQEINQKLAEVRKKRMEFDQGDGPRRPQGQKPSETKGPRKSFHHPKLDYVMAEIVYSPYMTKPNESYSQETFRVPERLSELKKKSQKLDDLPKEEVPFDMKEVKGRFMNEVANYNVSFVMPDDRLPGNTRRSMVLRKSMTGEASLVDSEVSSVSRASTALPKVSRSSVTSSISANKSSGKGGGKKLPSVVRGGSLAATSKIEVALFAVNKEFEDVRGELQRAETERDIKMSRSLSHDVDKSPYLTTMNMISVADDLSMSPSTAKPPFPETVASSSTSGKSSLGRGKGSGSDVLVARVSPRLEPLARPLSSGSSRASLPALSPLSGKHSLPPLSARRKEVQVQDYEADDDFLSPKKPEQDEEVYEDEFADKEKDDVRAKEEEVKEVVLEVAVESPNDYEDDFRAKEEVKEVEVLEDKRGEEDVAVEVEGVYEEDYSDDVAEETKQLPPPTSERGSGSSRRGSRQGSGWREEEKEVVAEVEEVESHDDYEDDVREFAEQKDGALPVSTSLTTEEVQYHDFATSEPIDTTSEPFNTPSKEVSHNNTSHSMSTAATQALYDDDVDDFDSEPAPSSLSVQQSEKHMSDFQCLYPQRADSFDGDCDVSIYPYGGNRNIQEIQTAMINSTDFEALVMSFGQMTHIMR